MFANGRRAEEEKKIPVFGEKKTRTEIRPNNKQSVGTVKGLLLGNNHLAPSRLRP